MQLRVYHSFGEKTTFFTLFLKKYKIFPAAGEILRPAIDNFFSFSYNRIRMKNIVLIGMPSSGKSTAGVLLAEKLGYTFLDCDDLIREAEHATLPQLISRYGAEGFLRIEGRVNRKLSAQRSVIATGGSVVYCDDAMEHLRSIGLLVYLKISEEEVNRRIPSLELRGVVMRGEVKTVSDLYRERVPLYEKYADLTIDCTGLNLERTVEKIVEGVMECGLS